VNVRPGVQWDSRALALTLAFSLLCWAGLLWVAWQIWRWLAGAS